MKIVIIVDGGIVQEVYTENQEVEVEVIDLDLSDFPSENDIAEDKEKIARYDEVRNSTLCLVY